MATYYVDFVNGLDANNGLGPDASDSTNKPWKTIGKLLGAAGMASGDTAYLSPAGPFREVVTVAMTSAVAETKVLGDPANAQGFKTSGGVRVAPGEVVWTAYTTDDTTAPSASDTLNLAGRDYLTFRYITFVGGTGNVIDANTQTSTNMTIKDCVVHVSDTTNGVVIDGAFGTPLVWLIERCLFLTRRNAGHIYLTPDIGAGSDYDLNVTIRNCFFVTGIGGQAVNHTPAGGAGSEKPGGVAVYNCTVVGGPMVATGSNAATSIPLNVTNSINIQASGNACISAGASGQIVENYNFLHASTTHTNVTPGGNTVTGTARAPNWHIGEERLWGAQPRMFMEPKAGSWMLTFGNDGTYTTSEDFLGLPRPGGGGSATKGIGYLGRGNTFTRGTGTVRTGSNALEITGPGTQDFQLPVDAVSTTVTCYVRWDATYAGTKPQMKVLNCEEAGVTAATATATGSAGSWEQLSLNFTPTRAGIVTIRLQSNDTNGGGKMFADDFDVS